MIFDNSKLKKTSNKNKDIKDLPIVEVVEFTENKEIPFCEDIRVDGEDLSVVLIDLAKPKEKEKELENLDSVVKPKVGFEHRYRISRMLSSDQADKETKKIDSVLPAQDSYNAESKPKVGFEYRYRVSRMLADVSIDDFKSSKEKHSVKKENETDKEEILDPAYDPKLKPKVGFEYRYIKKYIKNDCYL